ncbi:MAG: hypothetical protein AB7O65_07530 [Candidatus Korobacteraceae bacterium]
MTAVEVVFRYGQNPGPATLRAIQGLREVYGIRRLQFDEAEHTVRVEFDASRLSEEIVAALLRRTGLDLGEKLALV